MEDGALEESVDHLDDQSSCSVVHWPPCPVSLNCLHADVTRVILLAVHALEKLPVRLLIASKRLSHGLFHVSQTKDKLLIFRLGSCLGLEQVLHLINDP